jgi:ubiquinone/menaquinone biosynthesis C-methylase UbiE
LNETEIKKNLLQTFNTIAVGYDNPPLRFFQESAAHVPSLIPLAGNEKVLDVATGTGNVALAFSPLLPKGNVTAVDFSHSMILQARKKKANAGLGNIEFLEMDMESLKVPDNHYDIAVSAFGIFFVPDIEKQLRHISSKVKAQGHIVIVTFNENAFSPLAELFYARLVRFGAKVPIASWKRTASEEQCISLFKSAGLTDIKVENEDRSFYLPDASDWWHIIMNSGFRRFVSQLSQDDLATFKSEHLEETAKLASDQGIWLEMNILYTTGTKPI